MIAFLALVSNREQLSANCIRFNEYLIAKRN